jgi:hypothetical protein
MQYKRARARIAAAKSSDKARIQQEEYAEAEKRGNKAERALLQGKINKTE